MLEPEIIIFSLQPYLHELLSQYSKYKLVWIDKITDIDKYLSGKTYKLIIIDQNNDLFKVSNKIKSPILRLSDKIYNTENQLYLSKPISIISLFDRIELLLNNIQSDNAVRFGTYYDFYYDLKMVTNIITNESFYLTEKEVNIIKYLLEAKEEVTKSELLKSIWNHSSDLDTHTVETHIYRLRQKFNSNEEVILTNELGYKLKKH